MGAVHGYEVHDKKNENEGSAITEAGNQSVDE
jgi:hypothetical protein